MENPKKPNDFTGNKRKASEGEVTDDNIRRNNNASQEEEDEDLLALSLCFDFDRRVRGRPTTSSSEPPPQQQQQQQRLLPALISPPQQRHIQTLVLSQNSPPQLPDQLPFNRRVSIPVFVPPPQSPSTSGPAALPVRAPPPLPAESCPSPSPCPAVRSRRNSSLGTDRGERKIITPPFPWATDRKAVVHTMEYLVRNNITTVTGDVHCKRCDRKYEMEFDLVQKFRELRRFIDRRKNTMHDRAPKEWSDPVLPMCKHCGQENSAKPLIEVRKKHSINWLFLLLGQLLGLCTLEQLKYFCKHTVRHRTAAKDRLLYLTYFQLYKQLLPQVSV